MVMLVQKLHPRKPILAGRVHLYSYATAVLRKKEEKEEAILFAYSCSGEPDRRVLAVHEVQSYNDKTVTLATYNMPLKFVLNFCGVEV